MATTTHYGLTKPAGSDAVSISVINTNMDLIDAAIYEIIGKIYPVGSIYITLDNVNPGNASRLGIGTWEKIKDKFLLGDGDTYSAGNIGGAATHTLTSGELPSVTGSFRIGQNVPVNSSAADRIKDAGGVFTAASTAATDVSATTTNNGSKTYTNTVNFNLNGGTQQQMPIMPPYQVVYIWKRTA